MDRTPSALMSRAGAEVDRPFRTLPDRFLVLGRSLAQLKRQVEHEQLRAQAAQRRGARSTAA